MLSFNENVSTCEKMHHFPVSSSSASSSSTLTTADNASRMSRAASDKMLRETPRKMLSRTATAPGATSSLFETEHRSRQRTLKERLNASQMKSVHIHLPDSAKVLHSVVQNNETLLRLIGRFGGCTLRVPAKWPPHGQKPAYKGHPLRRVLSSTQMQRVVSHYGGTDLYIPKCTQHLLQLRNKALTENFCKDTRRGQSTGYVVQKLARRYRISDRRVWDILKNSATLVQESL